MNIKKVSSEMYSVGDLNVELLKTKSFGVIDEYKIVKFFGLTFIEREATRHIR